MTLQRKQVIVRMPPELHATVKAVARRLSLSVNDYILARVGADATERAGAGAVTDRIDALEIALESAIGERDDRLGEALEGLIERIGAAGAGGNPAPAGVTVADLQRLSRSIESVIKHETTAVQRALFAAITKNQKPTAAARSAAPTL